ncbi:MAG TPA: IclR family transcriptional regulator [Steroidobacteraceae bacterium]|nr:IclR family transcriptional regulator [Steroidobacteraceae bacterium]
MATPSLRSLEKALNLLGRIAESGEIHSISHFARQIKIPRSTAYRIAATLERSGLVTRLRRGHYLPGPSLVRLVRSDSIPRVLKAIGRPIIKKLAMDTGCTAHVGVFENGMVTYLLKAGRAAQTIFTREGTQLEAYCTGIGKVLLAALPLSVREEYLTSGPFIELTANTLTDPQKLRNALTAVADQGYAEDNAEMDSDLRCLAVPVRLDGDVIAALSISTRRVDEDSHALLTHLHALRTAANLLSARLTSGAEVTTQPQRSANE